MKRFKKLMSALLCATMLLSMAACGGSNTGDDKNTADNDKTPVSDSQGVSGQENVAGAEYKDTIVIGVTQAPEVMDPQMVRLTTDYMGQRLTHDTLFRFDDETGELLPWLCESWEIDGATWTMKLREGVKFHDGSEFTAEDVVFTFERGKGESTQISSYCNKIVDMEIVDTYTVKVTWNGVNVDMGGLFTNVKYSMLSKSACEADPDKGYLVGTGAYTLDELFENSYAIFKKADNYWGEPAISDTIEFRYIAEASARLIALQNGEIDMCISPATTELGYIEDDKDLELIQVQGARTVYLALNMNKEPFNNLEFRKAVAYAIDKQALVDIVIDGLGSPANSTIGPNCACNCDDALTGVEYNPEKAKEILAANGWVGTTIQLYCADSGDQNKAAIALQAQLQAVGITAEMNILGSAELTAATKAGEHDAYVATISVSDYAGAVRSQLYTGAGYNYSFFADEKVDQMVDEGDTITDHAQRMELYTELQQYVFDEMLYLNPLFRGNSNVAIVKGFTGVYYRSDLILDLSHAGVLAE